MHSLSTFGHELHIECAAALGGVAQGLERLGGHAVDAGKVQLPFVSVDLVGEGEEGRGVGSMIVRK
jgi:hypothetical protein